MIRSMLNNTLNPMLDHYNDHIKKLGVQYYLFTCFAIAYCGIPFQFWSPSSGALTISSIYLRGIASALSFLLLFKDLLSGWMRHLFPIYWYFVLLFCLPFLSTYMLFQDTVSVPWFFISILLLSLLVDWISFLAISLLGSFLGILAAAREGSLTNINTACLDQTFIAYTCLISILVISFFLRNRDRLTHERIKAYNDLSMHIAHEIRKPMAFVKNGCEGWGRHSHHLFRAYESAVKAGIYHHKINPVALNSLEKLPDEFRKTASDSLLFIEILLTQTQATRLRQETQLTDAHKTISRVLARWQAGTTRITKIYFDQKENFSFCEIPLLLDHVFYELLRNSEHFFKKDSEPRIDIWCTRTRFQNEIHIRDNGQGIEKNALGHIFKHGFTTRTYGTGIGLSFCKKAMEEMQGKIQVISQKNQFTEFVLIFPILTGRESNDS